MVDVNDDKEMVEGVIELLLKVEDLENRKQMVLDTLKDFDEEGVIYDREDFLNRVGVSIDGFNESNNFETYNAEKMSVCFSEDEDISHLFDNIGVSKDDYEIVDNLDIHFSSDGSPIEFAIVEQGIVRNVLKLIFTNPLIKLLVLLRL